MTQELPSTPISPKVDSDVFSKKPPEEWGEDVRAAFWSEIERYALELKGRKKSEMDLGRSPGVLFDDKLAELLGPEYENMPIFFEARAKYGKLLPEI